MAAEHSGSQPYGASGEKARRREVIAALGATAAWPMAAQAQQTPVRVRRIGILTGSPVMSPAAVALRQALVNALRERGWNEGQNLMLENRAAEGRAERFPELAAELVALSVDVIVAPNSQAVSAAMANTRTIPIVMIDVSHPVEAGFIATLARPGGNVTGVTNQAKDIGGKQTEILREIAPALDKVALIFTPSNAGSALGMREMVEAARQLRVTILPIPIDSAADIEPAFALIARDQPQALNIHPTPITIIHRQRILALALEHRLLTVAFFKTFAVDGALISYGPSQIDSWRRAATYVDRILKGTPPGDLPVEQPTKFDLVINLKTAKALNLTIPPTLLARADEVIE